MPRLYAVQRCDKMQGWQDLAYFPQWATAVRASELAAQASPGLVTRVIRKPHGFEPRQASPTPVFTTGSDTPVDYIPGLPILEPLGFCGVAEEEPAPEDGEWENEKLRRKMEKKRFREVSAKARIPTWYDRLNED